MTLQGVFSKIRVSRLHAVLASAATAVAVLQLVTMAQLAQAQVERGQARQERVVARLVSGDRCLEYKISAPRAGCLPLPAHTTVVMDGVHLVSATPTPAILR